MRKSGSAQLRSLHGSSQLTSSSFASLSQRGGGEDSSSQRTNTSLSSLQRKRTPIKTLDETSLFDGDITSTQNSAEPIMLPPAAAAAVIEEKKPKQRTKPITTESEIPSSPSLLLTEETPQAAAAAAAAVEKKRKKKGDGEKRPMRKKNEEVLLLPLPETEVNQIPETELVSPALPSSKQKKRSKPVVQEEEEELPATEQTNTPETELVTPPPPPKLKKRAKPVVVEEALAKPPLTQTQTQNSPDKDLPSSPTEKSTAIEPLTAPQFDFDANSFFGGGSIDAELFDSGPPFVPLDIPVTTTTSTTPPMIIVEGGAEEDFFETLLVKAGMQIDQECFALQTATRQQFTNTIRSNVRGADRIRLFMLSLEAFLSKQTANLVKCLLPLRIITADAFTTTLGRDPSLVQILLKIDALQPQLIQKLLEQFLFHALEEANAELPKRILQSLCWLDFVLHPKELTTTMLETLQALTDSENKWLQDAVQALPEILPDAFHGDAVVALTKLLKETRTQSAAIISCLSDLTIPTTALRVELIDTVLTVLHGKPLEELPVIVTFLLSSSASLPDRERQMYILKELRISLAFLDKPPSGDEEHSNEALVVKGMINSLLVHSSLCTCFLDLCKQKDTVLLVIDVWLLFALSRQYPQVVRDCIKQKFSHTEVFRKAIVGHHAALEVCGVDNAMDLASYFLRIGTQVKSAEMLRAFGSKLLAWLFQANQQDLRVRQEIVHTIVSHCCPGQKQEQEEEVESALACLDAIVCTPAQNNNNLVALAPFSAYVRSLMNELDRFNTFQARILIRVVSRLTLIDGEGVDELKIFLRKYLMSSEVERQCLGIVGTIQLASCLCNPHAENVRADVKEAVSLIDSMLRETMHPFTFDELARAIEFQELTKPVVQMLNETLDGAFVDWFTFETRAPVVFGEQAVSLGEEEMFGLDATPGQHACAIKILPMLSRGQNDASVKNRLPLLCPMLRCFLSTAREHCPDNLLTCPLVLPNLDHLAALDTRPALIRQVVCSSMLYACNWIREIVSSFSQVTLDSTNELLLVRRMNSLVRVERYLNQALMQVPEFCETLMLQANSNGAKKRGRPESKSISKAGGKRAKTGAVGAAAEEEEEDVDEEDGEAEEVAPREEGKTVKTIKPGAAKSAETQSAQAAMQAILRELSPHALRILASPDLMLVFKPEDDDEEEQVVVNHKELGVSALKLLLESLSRHLNVHIVEKLAFGRKKKNRHDGNELGVDELIDLINTLALPSLAKLFQQLCARTFQINVVTPSIEVKDSMLCIELVLSVLSKLGKLYTQQTISQAQLLRCFKHFTVDASSSSTAAATEVALPFTLRSMYHFFVLSTADSSVMEASLGIQVALCSFLRELVTLHSDAVDDAFERIALKDKLSKLCIQVLRQEWPIGTKSHYAAKPSKHNVGLLVDTFHEFSSDQLVAIAYTTEQMRLCLQLEPVDLPLLTTKTLQVFYSSTMSTLARTDLPESEIASLAMMCSSFTECVAFTKLDKISNQVLRDAMRYGRAFIDLFIKKHMPVLSIKLKRNQAFVMDEVVMVMQKSTRQLQNLCTHAKSKKDASILQAMPALRRSLESLLCSIKNMLKENDCLDKSSFTVGVLKARNLNGTLATVPKITAEEEE